MKTNQSSKTKEKCDHYWIVDHEDGDNFVYCSNCKLRQTITVIFSTRREQL